MSVDYVSDVVERPLQVPSTGVGCRGHVIHILLAAMLQGALGMAAMVAMTKGSVCRVQTPADVLCCLKPNSSMQLFTDHLVFDFGTRQQRDVSRNCTFGADPMPSSLPSTQTLPCPGSHVG